MNSKALIPVIAVIVAIVIWVSMTFYKAYQPKALVLQGEIDAQTYNISSKLPGRISEVFVKKGDFIDVGDIVFTISSPEVEAKLAVTQEKISELEASNRSREAKETFNNRINNDPICIFCGKKIRQKNR